MAKKVIKTNESIVPFFGDKLSFIKGLDPLALQNTSDSTFSLLLPGLNNVTGRIRYYSFYCWILDNYSRIIRNTDPNKQKEFIRSAEYIVALTSYFYSPRVNGIPGSQYAEAEIEQKQKTVHDISKAIYNDNKTTNNTYWKYSFGAFGQYYLGSLRDIGLISKREKDNNIYVRTECNNMQFVSGKKLGDAFDKNISENAKKIFFDAIKKQSINNEELKLLKDNFNLSSIPLNSDEHNLLMEMLFQKDYPLYIEENPKLHRKETIFHLLEYAKNHTEIKDRKFIYFTYDNKGKSNNEIFPTLFGWYFYQFNEFWQFANTAILNGTLDYLYNIAGLNWISLIELTQKIAQNTFTKLKENLGKDILTISDILDIFNPNEYNYFDEINQTSRIDRITAGFLLIFSQFMNNENELMELKNFGENNGLIKDGEGTTYFLNIFKKKINSNIQDYIFNYILKNIIYRHQYVAYKKMRGSNQTTQKFIIQEGHIRYINNFNPTYTGPRIGNLITFLEDLHILNKTQGITEFGKTIKFYD